MFKRTEKKIKAVFKMQFQATQVPQLKAKGLMISLVPVDVGKPTVRLPKAPIQDGTCTWESPIYETVKLIKEIKTGRIREKFYYLIVATGSSKTGFLGEVSIDFADLAEATKPKKLTLPLQTSKSGAILHVAVQRIQGENDSRHNEDDEESMAESPDSEDLSEMASPHFNGSLEDAESDSNDGGSRHGARETSIERLTKEMKALERKAELSELELQSLRKQIGKETKRGQQLSDQIACLQEERDALKAECEQLKSASKGKNDEEILSNNTQKESEKLKSYVEREKQLNKKLKLQLQKAQDSNSEYVLALRDLNKKLEHKNNEISRLSSKIKALRGSPGSQMDQNEESEAQENSHGNADEVEMQKQKIENLSSEIEILKEEKADIEMDVKRLTMDYENSEMENKELCSKLEQSEKEKEEIEEYYKESFNTAKQFKLRIASLEAEIKRHTLQYSESLNAIDDLEAQVENLHKELENQARAFEEDLEMVTEAKIQLEERARQADDALRKTRRNNATAAERLQEEFKQISEEMSLKIEENEKIADKAIAEAQELREKNEELEEMLEKVKEELQISRDQHKRMLENLPQQNAKQKTSFREESERWMNEKEDMQRQLASVRKEAEKLRQENASLKSQTDQKKTRDDNLQLEVKKLRLKNNEMKNQLVALETEKENLKKEMSKLSSKKEQESLQNKETDAISGKNKLDTAQFRSLLNEVASLKERNKSMEEELKEMHERYSEISLKFAEVEGERQQLVMSLRNLKGEKKTSDWKPW